ncbi:hypothetical protein [Streptomyces sp. NPDC001843]|uniref:hypothetical protein n=1 Tax=Streptomyces sp. NPDC001843 TaxID=3364617 RepID=UPI00369B346B
MTQFVTPEGAEGALTERDVCADRGLANEEQPLFKGPPGRSAKSREARRHLIIVDVRTE